MIRKEAILDYVQYKQLSWYGCVQQMGDYRLPKRVMEPTIKKRIG